MKSRISLIVFLIMVSSLSGCSSEDHEDDVDSAMGRGDLYDELGRTPPRMSLARYLFSLIWTF